MLLKWRVFALQFHMSTDDLKWNKVILSNANQKHNLWMIESFWKDIKNSFLLNVIPGEGLSYNKDTTESMLLKSHLEKWTPWKLILKPGKSKEYVREDDQNDCGKQTYTSADNSSCSTDTQRLARRKYRK